MQSLYLSFISVWKNIISIEKILFLPEVSDKSHLCRVKKWHKSLKSNFLRGEISPQGSGRPLRLGYFYLMFYLEAKRCTSVTVGLGSSDHTRTATDALPPHGPPAPISSES